MKIMRVRELVKKSVKAIIATLAAGTLMFQATASNAMSMGINLAFNPLHHTFQSGYYNSSTMGGYLTEIHNAHLSWVRVWVCDGLDGLYFDGSNNCTSIDGTVINNVKNFCSQANNLGITVEIVFINSADINSHPNLVTNTSNMNALINNGLVPLGKAIQPYTAQIDLVNEGDYTVGTVGWGYLRNFLGGAKTALVNNGVNRWVTMSIGFYTALTSANVGGLNFDFYEYHMYNDQGWCPIAGTFAGKPVELNEFGAATPSEGWNHNSYSFNQTLLNNYVNNAKAAGYQNFAPWCYINDGDYQLRGNQLMNDISNWGLNVNGSGGGTTGGTTGTTGGTIANGNHTMAPACATGSRLDVPSANYVNGQALQIWQSTGGGQQSWNFTSVGTNQYTMKVGGTFCLDSAGATAPGSAATIWTCASGNANQIWTSHAVSGGYYFSVQNSGLCLDVRASGSANGTVVQTYTCNGAGGLSQTWAVN